MSPNLSCIQFADDTNIFSSGSSLDDIFNVLNCELESISTWLRANKLVLNVSKSNYMIMTSPRNKILTNHYTLCIDGHVIEGVSEYKFLGVVIDDRMTWKKHINYICNKIAKGIGILVRARQLLYGESLGTIYNALIKPHFMYCITAWGNTYKTNLTRLHLMQKKIIRVLTRSEFYAHTEPLFNKLHMMNIFEMHAYFVGIFVFKCVNNVLPDNWNCTFTPGTLSEPDAPGK